jgi:hypothetical protein
MTPAQARKFLPRLLSPGMARVDPELLALVEDVAATP